MEALVRRNDTLQEGLLLRGRYDLVTAVREALVARELLAQKLNEGCEGQRLVLVEVEELRREERVVVRDGRPIERVDDGRTWLG